MRGVGQTRRGTRAASGLALAVLLLAGCIDPSDRRPGTWLRGELVQEAIDDWSFSAAHPEVFLETRTWYGVRHSVTVVCAASGPDLYVPSLYRGGGSFPESRLWNRNVVSDPRVRLQIGERLYPRRAVHVTDPAENARALEAFATKYPFWRELAALPEEERPPMAFVRMDPPD